MDAVTGLLASACAASRQHQAARRHLIGVGLASSTISRCVKDGSLLRLHRGAYALGDLPHRGRHLLSGGVVDLGYLAEVRSALLSLEKACADRRTAALLWQLDMLVEPRLVEVRVPRSQSRVDRVGVRARSSTATRVVELSVQGYEALSVTTALDTVLDCAVDRPLLEGLVIADSALRRKLVTVEELVAGVEARRNTRRVRKLQRLLELIDPESGSVLETMMRFLLVMNGLSPQSQYVINDRHSRWVGRVDFCFASERLIIECDGRRWHDPADARDRDRVRDNRMAIAGWRVLRFTWDEIRNRAGYVLESVREALVALVAA